MKDHEYKVNWFAHDLILIMVLCQNYSTRINELNKQIGVISY